MRIVGLILIALLSFTSVTGTALAAKVKVIVNGQTITDHDINQRALFMRLERRGKSNSDRRALAQKELIDEALMVAEANRLGFKADEKAVDKAYTRIAVNAKLSVGRLNTILNAAGVQTKTLKDRLRANLAWQAVVANVLRKKVKISDVDLDLAAREELGETITFDYMLTEVLFLNSAGGSVKSRTSQANQYRRNFNGCESAVELALSYRDAAVRKLGRRHSTQLAGPIAKELSKLNVGAISKPRTVANGVQMLAICEKNQANDLTFVKGKLRNEVGTEKLQTESEAYLKKLLEQATIERR
ncbi:peptidylprolyl isomerase [Maritalea sp.]|uniref:peptidylprolyl isomerase n=1 Tax=Maritalea sp. TaxID=2003361 RepID=UPI003EF31177